ncbi:hypothetical protein [Haloferula sp. BvORR071]|uniref:hypothetical protein n=1 Tax=Haloferula sp. BvORR071 TaxID=1396141 RepID=UPI000554AAB5|nr:hypothetical protein [Haloferula sp. BvORR071]
MKIPPVIRSGPILLCLLPLLASSCADTRAWRHKDQTVTVAKRSGLRGGAAMSYWLVGAKPGQVTNAEDVSVYRKTNGAGATLVKCSGFVDTTRPSRIELRLAEKRGGHWEQAWVNGSHKLSDENAPPKPFYHWLIL